MSRYYLLISLFLSVTTVAQTVTTTTTDTVKRASHPPAKMTTITFSSLDGLQVTADQYLVNDTLPWMILCHQAGYSRGEYDESAKKFTRLGYNCLAIDQRSGETINDVKNETAERAEKANKGTEYLDAEQDITAALNFAYDKNKKPVVLVGSSYSASLVLKIAAGNAKVKAVVAFSPGEYFGRKLNLKQSITTLTCPVFLTSARDESAKVATIAAVIPATVKVQFTPVGSGRHGASALWTDNESRTEYWIALLEFMNKI